MNTQKLTVIGKQLVGQGGTKAIQVQLLSDTGMNSSICVPVAEEPAFDSKWEVSFKDVTNG